MRLKYYKLTLRQMRFKKPFVLTLSTIFLIFCIFAIFNNNIKPTIISLSETNAKKIALLATTQAIDENIKDIKYDDLINLEKDKEGKISSISTNVMQMSRLSNKISIAIQENIINQKENEIDIPIGIIFSNNILGGYGPNFKIKILPTGINKVDFMSEFESMGVNQTKHRIFLRVTTSVKIIAPFLIDKQDYVSDIVLAETVIVGDVPTAYYNLTGMGNLNAKDSINLMGE